MPYHREQLESTLQRSIGRLIVAGLNDPRIEGLVSVTRVRVEDEGRIARVGVSVLPEEKQAAAVRGLRAASGHIRRLLDGEVRVRTMPHLEFYADDSLKKQARVLSAIHEAMAEDERAESPPRPAAGEASDPTPEPEPEDPSP